MKTVHIDTYNKLIKFSQPGQDMSAFRPQCLVPTNE